MKDSIASNSWAFLYDFYQNDKKSIVGLLNRALSKHSKLSLDAEEFDCLCSQIGSFVTGSLEIVPYSHFLNYVIRDNTNNQECLLTEEELEDNLIHIVWGNLSKVFDNFYLSYNESKYQMTTMLMPYLILHSMDLSEDWLLYDTKSTPFYIDRLKKAYKICNNTWHIRFFHHNYFRSKLFWKKKLSSNQLFPLAILLIVLHREWVYSKEFWEPEIDGEFYLINKYLDLKRKALLEMQSTSNVNLSMLYGLYSHFKEKNQDILNRCTDNYRTIFHPVIAKNILDSESYSCLYYWIENEDEQKKPHIQKYKHIESMNKDKERKRLLVDYLFPYTSVKDNDTFVPSSYLADEIYMSLKKGIDYKNYYRDPQTDEKFDYIQIEPITNIDGSYSDMRAMVYRNNLNPYGNFATVISEEDFKIQDIIRQELTFYRHDLKNNITKTYSRIDNFKTELYSNRRSSRIVDEVVKSLSEFIATNNLNVAVSDSSAAATLRQVLRNAESDARDSIGLYPLIKETRDHLENAYYENCPSKDLNKNLSDCRDKIREYSHNELLQYIENSKELINKIDFAYKVLENYINNVGKCDDVNDELEKICLKQFLANYFAYFGNAKNRIKITADLDKLDESTYIYFNISKLYVILDSIMDNAEKHGFPKDYETTNPGIHIEACDKSDDTVLLKICNNGKPIEIGINEYRLKGVYSGITGHTGIGGYQICRYIEQQGGYVDITRSERWNTEINLHIKTRI